jgi:hypothetical protein
MLTRSQGVGFAYKIPESSRVLLLVKVKNFNALTMPRAGLALARRMLCVPRTDCIEGRFLMRRLTAEWTARRKRGFIVAAVLLVGLALTAGPGVTTASATTVYYFNTDYCTGLGGCLNGGLGGTVTLNQAGANTVDVSVALNPVAFHDTNAFVSFVFNLAGISTLTSVTNINPGSFSLVSLTAGSIHEDGAGDFEFGLDGNGTTTGLTALSFRVIATGLTEASFNELSSGGGTHSVFAASVTTLPFGSSNTCTGVIGANQSQTPVRVGSNDGGLVCGGTQVPEATSIMLLGFGLAPLGLWVWKQGRRPVQNQVR